jgi:hypothetical protein
MGLPGKKSRRDCGSLGCVDKEGRVSTELVGGDSRGGRTSDVASHTVPISRAQIAWQGRQGKGRVAILAL